MYDNSMGPADMAAIMNRSGGYGDMGFGNGGAWWWIIILFLFGMNGGWGRGFGGYGNGGDGIGSEVQRGFDQSAVMSGIAGVQSGVQGLATQLCGCCGDMQNTMNQGFSAVQQSLCNGFAGVNAGMANGFAQAEIAENGRQMANMNQMFGIQSALQQCCCDNRAATADLKYTVATEACADRAAVEGALRDVTAQGVANTQALLNTINGGIQSIKDQMCNDKIDAKNEKITELQQQLYMRDLAASQANQNALIQQGFAAEVDALYNRLNTCPVPTTPVYGRTPIFTCGNNGYVGCGYGM